MQLTRRPIVSILLVLIPLVAIGQNSSSDEPAKAVNYIVDAVGLENQLEQPPENIRQQFANNPFGLTTEDNELLIERFEEGFAVNSLMDTALDTFRAQYNDDYATSTLKWLKQGDTQIVTGAEKEFYSLQGLRKRVVAKYEMEQEPPSAERDSLITSLVETTSAVESTIESYAVIFRSVISAFGKLSEQQTFSESQIDNFTENYKMQIQPEVEREVHNQFLIMFYDLDDETISEYISFYKTEPGTWLSSTITKSKHAAFKAAAKRFVESIDRTN